METTNIICGVLGGLWAIALITPILAGLLDQLTAHWDRSETKGWMAKTLYAMTHRFGVPSCDTRDSPWLVISLLLGLAGAIAAFLISLVLCVLVEVSGATLMDISVLIGVVVGIIVIPRFIIDICKATKYDKNTGKLLRLEELEEQQRILAETIDMMKGGEK